MSAIRSENVGKLHRYGTRWRLAPSVQATFTLIRVRSETFLANQAGWRVEGVAPNGFGVGVISTSDSALGLALGSLDVG